jgi:hypothetical protein
LLPIELVQARVEAMKDNSSIIGVPFKNPMSASSTQVRIASFKYHVDGRVVFKAILAVRKIQKDPGRMGDISHSASATALSSQSCK